MKLRKHLRRYISRGWLQRPYRLLYRVALAGMNYGGAGSSSSAGDRLALERLARMKRERPIVFDVGANVGIYAAQVFDTVPAARVHAFEPSSVAFQKLCATFDGQKQIDLIQAGVGASMGTAMLYARVPGSVLGSVYASGEGAEGEKIEIVTIDDYCERHGITHIDLLKLDLEGGELDALRGASRMMSAGAIDLVQFEFGQPSLGARTFFADLYDLLCPRYDLYRILPSTLVPLLAYHETLEVFMSTNYLAIAKRL